MLFGECLWERKILLVRIRRAIKNTIWQILDWEIRISCDRNPAHYCRWSRHSLGIYKSFQIARLWNLEGSEILPVKQEVNCGLHWLMTSNSLGRFQNLSTRLFPIASGNINILISLRNNFCASFDWLRLWLRWRQLISLTLYSQVLSLIVSSHIYSFFSDIRTCFRQWSYFSNWYHAKRGAERLQQKWWVCQKERGIFLDNSNVPSCCHLWCILQVVSQHCYTLENDKILVKGTYELLGVEKSAFKSNFCVPSLLMRSSLAADECVPILLELKKKVESLEKRIVVRSCH